MKPQILLTLGILAVVLVAGCISETGQIISNEEEDYSSLEPIETINVMGCDFGDSLNLLSTYKRGKGGLAEGAIYVGSIPTCKNVSVEILERICSNEIEYDLVRYGSFIGWVTRRALMCPDGVGCYIAPDTICKY